MNKTKKYNLSQMNFITVDIEQLSAMLCCGQATARRIGELAQARVQIGRRVLYSVDKVKQYINAMSE